AVGVCREPSGVGQFTCDQPASEAVFLRPEQQPRQQGWAGGASCPPHQTVLSNRALWKRATAAHDADDRSKLGANDWPGGPCINVHWLTKVLSSVRGEVFWILVAAIVLAILGGALTHVGLKASKVTFSGSDSGSSSAGRWFCKTPVMKPPKRVMQLAVGAGVAAVPGVRSRVHHP